MSWQHDPRTATLAPNFHSHPDVWMCGLEGAGLFAKALSYCAEYLTDGALPGAWVRSQIPRGDRRKIVTRLVDAGLFERVSREEYRVVDYLDHNPSRDQVLTFLTVNPEETGAAERRTERARKAA